MPAMTGNLTQPTGMPDRCANHYTRDGVIVLCTRTHTRVRVLFLSNRTRTRVQSKVIVLVLEYITKVITVCFLHLTFLSLRSLSAVDLQFLLSVAHFLHCSLYFL